MKHARLSFLALSLPLALAGCSASPDYAATVDQAPPTLLVMQEAPEAQATESPALDTAARAAAVALLDSYSDEQRAAGVFAVDHANRTDWHFVPRNRPGVKLGDLSDAQKHLLHNLLQTALSDSGYLKVTDILWLETVLAELENNPRSRDVGKYVVHLYGDPIDESAAWGWRFEGHHLSINLLYADGGVSVTPMFLGTNPAVVPTGPLAGKRVLADEHNLALELAQSMSAEQREKMMIGQRPRDVITGPGNETRLSELSGITGADLTKEQELLLVTLTMQYVMNVQLDHYMAIAPQLLGLNNQGPTISAHFAWAGPTDGSGPFYYRIHSSTFVIEYSVQNGNHVHSVLHDLTDPLGEDLLRRHFEQHEHE